MFGKRFAFEFQGPGDGNWEPAQFNEQWHDPRVNEQWHDPRIDEQWHGPRIFRLHRGRGPFGSGGPFGPGPGGPGEALRLHRAFGRGDMKYVLLELLQERPMHGYEMIKALEEKSGGFYSPSPGSVYPTLQMLEDRGFVTVQEVEGKKVYSITDAGRALLAERQQEEEQFAGPPWMRWRGQGGHRSRAEMQALRSEAAEVARLFAIAGRMSFQSPEQLARLHSIIERARKDLTDMIYGAGSQQGQTPPTPPGQSQGSSDE